MLEPMCRYFHPPLSERRSSMKIVTHLLAALVGALLVLIPLARRIPAVGYRCAVSECIHMRQAVEKEIGDISQDVAQRLAAFGAAVSQDRDFSMKLLVERDALAPEVTEIASKYMQAMGLAVLDVTDSALTVISSGHYPARAGSAAPQKAAVTGPDAVAVVEDMKGTPTLTLQVRSAFTCVDIPLYCFGGIAVDNAFLAGLAPRQGVQVILKLGDRVTGIDSVVSISGIEDNRIIINDIHYIASSFTLPTADDDMEGAELIVIMEEPRKTSLLELL